MARRSERETSAQQTRNHGARDGNGDCEGTLRTRGGIARRYQIAQSQRASGRETLTRFVIGYPLSVIRDGSRSALCSLISDPVSLSAFRQNIRAIHVIRD